MKRLVCGVLVMLLVFSCAAAETLPEFVQLQAGESQTFELPFEGSWDSENPELAYGQGNTVYGLEEGYTMLYLTNGEEEAVVEVEVLPAEDDVPPVIRDAIDIAIAEWKALDGKQLDKTIKGNKYVKWWGGNNIGWCGAFASYCLDKAGVPMEKSENYQKVKPRKDGEPYSVRLAGVGKLNTAFGKMERLSDIPRPGYLVIYGADYLKNLHVGMVEDVKDLGGGLYEVYTVEGNMSSTIKRYAFYYNAQSPDELDNMEDFPEEMRTQPDVYEYDAVRYTKRDGKNYSWYIMCFCQTWQ